MPQRSEIHYVYADGSCLGNPGPGGWAAVIVKPSGVSRTIYGGDPATTNNRMELTGAIEGAADDSDRHPSHPPQRQSVRRQNHES